MTSRAFENVTKLNALGRSVKEFGAKGDGVTDDTAAFAAAFAASPVVYVPEGIYLVDASNAGGCRITSGSNYHLYGEGEKSVIKRFSYNPARANIIFDSGSASTFIDGIRISNLKFLGDVQTLGHNELYGHMFVLDGVRRVLIENCYFEGPRSDAILFGSGPGGPTSERHNFDLVVRNCVFNGVVNGVDGGRNAISVIDCDGMLIDGNTFRNWSRNDMPGSIDFEPDYTFSVIKNVHVVNNNFTNCAGIRGHVVLNLGNSPNLENVHIIGNSFDGNNAVAIDTYALSEPVVSHNLIVANNTARNCVHFFKHEFGSVWGVLLENNVSYSASAGGQVAFGSGVPSRTHKQIGIFNNQFTGTGTVGLIIYDNIQTVQIKNNVFSGYTQAHVRIGATGDGTSSLEVSIVGNIFKGTPAQRSVLHQNTTPNALTNSFFNNYAPAGVTHDFQATLTDNCGTTTNTFTTTNNPSDFTLGVHVTAVANGSIIGSGTDFGLLTTFRQFSSDVLYTWQQFKPMTALNRDKIVYRNATGASAWTAWFAVTGV